MITLWLLFFFPTRFFASSLSFVEKAPFSVSRHILLLFKCPRNSGAVSTHAACLGLLRFSVFLPLAGEGKTSLNETTDCVGEASLSDVMDLKLLWVVCLGVSTVLVLQSDHIDAPAVGVMLEISADSEICCET